MFPRSQPLPIEFSIKGFQLPPLTECALKYFAQITPQAARISPLTSKPLLHALAPPLPPPLITPLPPTAASGAVLSPTHRRRSSLHVTRADTTDMQIEWRLSRLSVAVVDGDEDVSKDQRIVGMSFPFSFILEPRGC